jgi:hypothetical protein
MMCVLNLEENFDAISTGMIEVPVCRLLAIFFYIKDTGTEH